jgi:hypothetical protein
LEDTLVLETSALGHESSTLSSATNMRAWRPLPVRTNAPVADGEANGLQSRDWWFESAPECHAPQANGEHIDCNPVERGSIPRRRSITEGAKRRQRLLVPKTRAP